jgi:hypothetical protein
MAINAHIRFLIVIIGRTYPLFLLSTHPLFPFRPLSSPPTITATTVLRLASPTLPFWSDSIGGSPSSCSCKSSGSAVLFTFIFVAIATAAKVPAAVIMVVEVVNTDVLLRKVVGTQGGDGGSLVCCRHYVGSFLRDVGQAVGARGHQTTGRGWRRERKLPMMVLPFAFITANNNAAKNIVTVVAVVSNPAVEGLVECFHRTTSRSSRLGRSCVVPRYYC